MGIFDKIFGKKKGPIDLTVEELVEAGACPNCWGKQEYEGKFYEFSKDQTKSNISHDKKHQKAFVQQFVETHVSGIKLKKDGAESTCPSCHKSFKHGH